MKALGDEMYALGLNHFVFHRYAQQPHPTARPGMTMGPWGFHFDRTNTWFDDAGPWLTYAARCQHLLRQGSFAADILYFAGERSEEHTSELQSLMRISYAVFCLKKKKQTK